MVKRQSGTISSIDDLVAYCVGRVVEAREDCTFERLVYECYTQFPESFRFERYPEWPDAARINKAWLRCRTDKGWVRGSVQEGFQLTERGQQIAASVAQKLEIGYATANRNGGWRSRGRHEAILKYIRNQEPYIAFEHNPATFEVEEPEIRSLFGGTMETPTRVLRQNLHGYKEAAVAHNDTSVLEFLERCEVLLLNKVARNGVQNGTKV